MKRSHKAIFLSLLGVVVFSSLAWAKSEAFRSTFFMIDKDRWYISHGWSNGKHQSCEWRADALSIRNNKMVMTLSDRGGKLRDYGCPEIHTNARLGYGLYEARMRTAAGSGLNTAFFTFIGPPNGVAEHDEIDFEFLGKNPRTVDINYHVNGKSKLGKSIDLGFDASKDFHDYAFDWTAEGIKWFVDGRKVFETPSGGALPRNPGHLFFSLWSGSPEWMGAFRYKEPVEAEVAWARFTPHN